MFSRPVDPRFPVRTYYSERSPRYEWSVDPDNGFWIPVKDRENFGHHCGVDFDCPHGTIVHAMADGFIVRAGHESAVRTEQGAGLHIIQLVMLEGFDSWALKYSHLKAVYVKPGQRVDRYTAMAESGGQGLCAPFLHVDLMDLRRQWRPIPIESLDG